MKPDLPGGKGCTFDGRGEKMPVLFARDGGINELIWWKRYGQEYLKIISGEGWSRIGIVGRVAPQGEDAESTADLRAAKGGGFGIGKRAKFAGASLNDVAGQLAG